MMCSIFGAISFEGLPHTDQIEFSSILKHIAESSKARGRDGFGVIKRNLISNECDIFRDNEYSASLGNKFFEIQTASTFIGNCRAEPTTEYVKEKHISDQQPYSLDDWSIVHNGTIANDSELRTGRCQTLIDSAAIVEQLAMRSESRTNNHNLFLDTIKSLKGSFAILAENKYDPSIIFGATNYRPIWVAKTSVGIFFASSRHFFPRNITSSMIAPYSTFIADGHERTVDVYPLRSKFVNSKALVVCSGGLDSVVAATFAKKTLMYDVTLLHFNYGCRAEFNETRAVAEVAGHLNVPLVTMDIPIYAKSDSPLLDSDSKLAGGEEGAEFAHEWVPARNLVMLSIATAYAEANGFDTIVLGNNMEEAGAYPDNEPEFVERFNDLLPFAVGANKHMNVIMPVGNLMKHEIVKLGHDLAAPMHLTWSCYRNGEKHCGKCGPCYMRRKAFEINNLPEVIEYEEK